MFPIKAELLKPQEEMERHITDLIKQVKTIIMCVSSSFYSFCLPSFSLPDIVTLFFRFSQSLEDVTGGEFKMFMDFLTSLSIFGGKAAQERMQELVEIIEGQADLNAQFDVSLLCCIILKMKLNFLIA